MKDLNERVNLRNLISQITLQMREMRLAIEVASRGSLKTSSASLWYISSTDVEDGKFKYWKNHIGLQISAKSNFTINFHKIQHKCK